MDLKRVLSIQSHVVSGYVGNKAATFPLQVLGFDVDAINSVQLSNHTGYKSHKGQILNDSELKNIFDGLKLNNLDRYSHLLTGYCRSESFLLEIASVLKHLKSINQQLIYVCDPVMGDQGTFYVPQALLPIYKDILIPLADIITPNQFEAEQLSGIKILNERDAFMAMRMLHSIGPSIVIITSLCLENCSKLIIMGSIKGSPSEYVRFEIDKLDAFFHGTGDLFASLLLAWLYKFPENVKIACEKTLSTINMLLAKTIEHSISPDSCKYEVPLSARMELRLVQNLTIILDPPEICKGELVQVLD